jgi:TRAP-type mannitol/chloroaromatic compound transport system substrate-binding protein
MSGSPTRRGLISTLGAGVVAMPAIAGAATERRWRCVTSWSRNMIGPGGSARRLAESITAMSNGELTIDVFAAGELVPALQVFDAVSAGTVELAHTAAVFWGGKMPAAPLFTTQPFGLSPDGHVGWLAAGGHALWDELYAPHGVRAFMAGNTGPSSAGWFRKPITTAADFKGLRIRATGIGGEVYNALGATALAIPPADTFAAFERGVIDAVELLAPANDLPAGLDRIAKHLVFPGFNKPNGPSELLINQRSWATLPKHVQLIIETACRAEHDLALAETLAANSAAVTQLAVAGVLVHWLDVDALGAARVAATAVMERIAGTSPLASRIVAHLAAYQRSSETWQRLTTHSRAALARV